MELIDIEVATKEKPYFYPRTREEFSSCSPMVDSPYMFWAPDIYERFRTRAEFLEPTHEEKRGFTHVLD